ncbi:hypothetical protein [Streptomyces sp. TLI_171]|uniref:hypothetical protein n=1 Tax=Streptomyces sp. TLI_171 TaxID=1938859 RepID=UPI000C5055C6|nr:hypothetical protein [Streptomyces sp. TLI_171]RKE20380.1 hypothetical protein BX266_3736 [Streptomyces sp. TLI_171]
MSNPPRLLAEDRAEYARLLDEALRDPSVRQALAAPGEHLTAEQLHTKALADADTVAAPAAAEYEHYLALRTALAERPDGAPPAGPGVFPVLTVLTPVLAGAAGLILLLLGWLLRAAAPDLALGRSTVTAGVVALAVAAAALLIGGAGLVLTALRDAAAPDRADPQQHADLAEARAAWQAALRERALLPWLHANLGAAPAAQVPRARTAPPDLHSPGYSRATYSSPGFSSPGAEGLTDPQGRHPRHAEFSGPGYSSPDFTSPGPEGLTDDRGRPRPDGPGFTSPGPERLTDPQGRPRTEGHTPGWTPPDFTSPAEGRTPRRPGFSSPDHDSPDWSSPDFTGPGPEGLTDEDGNPRPDGPGFTRPGHDSPDFTGPDEV